MKEEAMKELAVTALEDMKAVNPVVMDVRGKSSVTDYMIVVSGTSDRHVKAIANNLVVEMKKAGVKPLGVEGDKIGEWVLVDLADVIVHIMLPDVRDFYQLEKLWEAGSIDEIAEMRPQS